MKDNVLKIISTVSKISVDDLKQNLDTPNLWNSFIMLEIVIALEDEFDISFSKDEIASMKTASVICKLVTEKN